MIRMHINVGNNHNVKPRDIVGAIANEAGIEGRLIGSVDIFDSFTFVEIPESHVDRVMEKMDKRMIKGKPISIEPAKDGKGKPKGPSKYGAQEGSAKRKPAYNKEGGSSRGDSNRSDSHRGEGSRSEASRDRDKKRVKTVKPQQ